MPGQRIDRILFIKTKHIGDALLMTPTVVAARQRYPQAQIWAVVRRGTEGILEGCPELDRVLTTAPPVVKFMDRLRLGEEIRLISDLRGQRFDVAIDLSDSSRGRWIALLSGAKRLATDGSARPISMFWRSRFHELRQPPSIRKAQHRAIKDAKVASLLLELPEMPPPLRFDDSRMRPWPGLPCEKSFVVMHPGTRWQRKRWPVEKWVRLGHHISQTGRRIVVSAGPDEREIAEAAEISQQIGNAAVSASGKAGWAQLAWIMRRADLFVGVDTAAMHLAAACQLPVVGIFGPSNMTYWSPWHVSHQIVRPPAPAGTHHDQLVTATTRVEDVMAACDGMLGRTPC